MACIFNSVKAVVPLLSPMSSLAWAFIVPDVNYLLWTRSPSNPIRKWFTTLQRVSTLLHEWAYLLWQVVNASQLRKTVDDFSSTSVCTAPSRTMKLINREEASSSVPAKLVFCRKVHDIFSNTVLLSNSIRQTTALAIAYIIWRASESYLTSNL